MIVKAPNVFRQELMRSFDYKLGVKIEAIEKALKVAVPAVEKLLDVEIAERTVELTMDPATYPTFLPHFPIREFRMVGAALESQDIDERLGLLMTHLPPFMYRMSYKVGQDYDSLPAIVKELLKKLVQYLIAPNSVEEEDVVALIESGRFLRMKSIDERNRNAETMRAPESQGSDQSSSDRYPLRLPPGWSNRPSW